MPLLHSPPKAAPRNFGKISVIVVLLALMPVTLVAGYMAGRVRRVDAPRHATSMPDGARRLKSGPWGDLEVLPMMIAAPSERLPVRALEDEVTHWVFPGYT